MASNSPLLPVFEARARVLALCTPLPKEATSVDASVGRALLEPVIAARTVPPWDNSAMDGYALRAADVPGAGAKVKVAFAVHAGQTAPRPLVQGECARIMTGAPLPDGADTVVMQEHTRREGDEVEILKPVAHGQHVRRRGEDATEGEPLLPEGTPIGLAEAGLAWAQGFSRLSVPRRPKVAVLSTGDELCAFDELAPGKIVDTNGPTLALAAKRLGAVVTPLGIAKDTVEDVMDRLRAALGFDLVITSAGVSVGDRDVVREALAKMEVQMDFWRVAVKPGKPLAVGKKNKTVFFGLPGNPTSSLVSFELFVRPALRRLMGHVDVEPLRVPGLLDAPLEKSAGITHYLRATVELRDGQLIAHPLQTQGSGALRSAAGATHLIELPQDSTSLAAGAQIALLPLGWAG